MKLRIVVVEDSAIFLIKLLSVLGSEFDIVATAIDGKSSLEIIRICQPDIVILNLDLPGLNGMDVTRALKKQQPSPAIIICSVENDPEVIEAAQQAGVLGFVSKARIASDLVKAVRSVARGQSFVSLA